MNDRRKMINEESKFRVQQAYDMMVRSGDDWIKKNGDKSLIERTAWVKAHIRTWNQITKSTIPFSLQSIDTMILMMSTLPTMIGMDVIMRNEYRDTMACFSAIRNALVKERNDKMKLSTGLLDSDKK